MLTYRKYTEIAENTPFLLLLAKKMFDFKQAKLYVTGEYSYNLAVGRQLPKTIEIKSTLTKGEVIALLSSIRDVNYDMRGNELILRDGDKHFVYTQLANKDLLCDAKLRDFSMNCIYISVEDGEAFDPCGALDDINNSRLMTTAEPKASFLAAPIRIMSMVRLCCEHNFAPSNEMLAAMKETSYALANANIDSIRCALYAILMSDTSKVYDNIDILGDNSPVLRGLMMLREAGVFEYIIPELSVCKGVEQRKRYHIYDVQEHMLHTCAATPAKLYMRIAGLLHDIGKPEAYKSTGGKNMHGHDRIGAGLARIALRRLRCKEDLINKVCRIIATHMYDIAGIAKVDTLKKRFAQWGYGLTSDMIDFRFADVKGSGSSERTPDSAIRFRDIFEQMKADDTPFSIYELKITGKEIAQVLNLSSGSEINDVKRELLRHCAVYPHDNVNSKLLELIKNITIEH